MYFVLGFITKGKERKKKTKDIDTEAHGVDIGLVWVAIVCADVCFVAYPCTKLCKDTNVYYY